MPWRGFRSEVDDSYSASSSARHRAVPGGGDPAAADRLQGPIVDTYLVQILPFIASPFFIYLFYSFFLGLPGELFEAARIDGAGAVRAYRLIALPLIKPAIATSAILSFLAIWGGLFWPLMVTRSVQVRPVTVGLSQVAGTLPTHWGDIMAMSVAISTPILIVFFIFQPAFIRSIASSGLKG